MRTSLISKLKILKKKAADKEERPVLEPALKMCVKPRYKKTEIALEFVNMFGFVMHSDDRI